MPFSTGPLPDLSLLLCQFGHSGSEKPRIDPFSSHVDEPVCRIFYLDSVFTSIEIIGLDKHINEHKIVNIFLPFRFNICSGSHSDGSFEYPQYMFRLRNKKIRFSAILLTCIKR